MLLSSAHFTFVAPVAPCQSLPNVAFAKAPRTVTVISQEMQQINPAALSRNCSVSFVRGFVLLGSWQSLAAACRKALGDSHPPGDRHRVFSLKVILEKKPCSPPAPNLWLHTRLQLQRYQAEPLYLHKVNLCIALSGWGLHQAQN